jgi:hypothetical protein
MILPTQEKKINKRLLPFLGFFKKKKDGIEEEVKEKKEKDEIFLI